MSTEFPFDDMLETARSAAEAARAVILKHFRTGIDIETKADRTPVTIADREAEAVIHATIVGAFPDHGFFGEETGRSGEAESEFLWLVDPIDGTKSFVRGYGMFSTQIALMHRDRLVLGVSCAPTADETAWAMRGNGAWLNGDRLQVSVVDTLENASVSTGNIGSLASGPGWGRLGGVLAAADRTRGYGDYYHYHRLAEGALDAVIESDVNILDIAALSVIVEEAGGVMTDLNGGAIDLDTRSVLAATPGLHATLRDALRADA